MFFLFAILSFVTSSCYSAPYNRLGELNFLELLERDYPQWYENNLQYKQQEYWMYRSTDSVKKFADTLNALFAKNYNPHSTAASEPYHIPPIVHQIWLGTPLPEECKQLQQTWLKSLPEGWTYMLWTEQEIDTLGLVNRELYDKAQNYAQKSDVARYEILLKYGGLYADFDCECLRFDDIINFHKHYDFYAAVEPVFYNFMLGNAVIACIPQHPIIHTMVYSMQDWLEFTLPFATDPEMPVWLYTALTTGPGYFSAAVCENSDTTLYKNIIFPPAFFYPFVTRTEILPRTETSIIHHFHNSWFSYTEVPSS